MGKDGNKVMAEWLEEHRQMLCQAIAEFAVFCPVDEYDKKKTKDPDKEAYFRHCGKLIRRSKKNEKITDEDKNKFHFDDNSDINDKFKRLVKMSGCENYITCHIYGMPYYPEVFSAVANIVLIPEIIAGLSDTYADVMNLLQYRAYELYGWFPCKRVDAPPKKPEGYDAIKWNSPVAWTAAKSRAQVVEQPDDLRERLKRWAGKPSLLVYEAIRIIHNAGDEMSATAYMEALSDVVTNPAVTISSLMCNSGNAYGAILERTGNDRIAIKAEYRDLIARLWK